MITSPFRTSVFRVDNIIRGPTTAEKLRGPRFGSQHRARPKAGWVLGAEGSGGIIPGKFLKTQMLNPAFW